MSFMKVARNRKNQKEKAVRKNFLSNPGQNNQRYEGSSHRNKTLSIKKNLNEVRPCLKDIINYFEEIGKGIIN